LMSVCGYGTDSVDLQTARKLRTAICNIPDRTAPLAAEHALGLMFAVAKRAWYQTNELKNGRWTRLDNVYLRVKTPGLVGAGAIAAAMAGLARAGGIPVRAWTLDPSPERAARLEVEFLPLPDLLGASDLAGL